MVVFLDPVSAIQNAHYIRPCWLAMADALLFHKALLREIEFVINNVDKVGNGE